MTFVATIFIFSLLVLSLRQSNAIGLKSLSGSLRRLQVTKGGNLENAVNRLGALVKKSGSKDSDHPIPSSLSLSHRLTVNECLDDLMTDSAQGLATTEAERRFLIYGENRLVGSRKPSLLSLFLRQFDDRLVQILLGIAFSSLLLAYHENDSNAYMEPLSIVAILLINAMLGVFHGNSAEDSVEALKSIQSPTACVLRDGKWVANFPAARLVPGDIVSVRVGDRIPADIRLISLKTASLGTDESCLTGESESIFKSVEAISGNDCGISAKHNMLFSGTSVTNGACIGVVTRTGMLTEIGKIEASLLNAASSRPKTPLTLSLEKFGDDLTRIVGVLSVFVWLFNYPKFSSPIFGSKVAGAIYYGKLAIATGVAALPEGLPAVITLCLSLGTQMMAKKKAIIRKLSAVETLGCATVICTDKTGTLTTNQMTVSSVVTLQGKPAIDEDCSLEVDDSFSNNEVVPDKFNQENIDIDRIIWKEYEVQGTNYDPHGEIVNFQKPVSWESSSFMDIAEVCSLCNDAQILWQEGRYEKSGDATEAALRVFVEKLVDDGTVATSSDTHHPHLLPKNHRLLDKYHKMATLEFNRDRKSMSVICRPKAHPTKNRLLVKGAADQVLARCNYGKLESGEIVPLTSDLRASISQAITELGSRPLRCLGLAYRDILDSDVEDSLAGIESHEEAVNHPNLRNESYYAEVESNLIWVGLCGLKDPSRPEVVSAIDSCRSANVRVMMLTGDSKATAVAIAQEVHILLKNESIPERDIFTASEFFSLPESVQLEYLKTGNKVFCRVEPQDKQRLVSMLDRLGEVTAMTGDGVNDAPALQQAAIGIAMGITGTEVAKSASDMIIADDNFVSIVSAIEIGRHLYVNMQSFIGFLLSSNFGEVLLMMIASLLGLPEPLTPISLLVLNLLTDGPPATALSFNPSEENVMLQSPRRKDVPIISRSKVRHYMLSGLMVSSLALSSFVWWYMEKGISFFQLRHWEQCQSWSTFHPLLSFESASSSLGANVVGDPCEIFTVYKGHPQTVALTTIVFIQLLKALSAVSEKESLFRVPPWKNPVLLPSVLAPLLLHVALVNIPWIASSLGMQQLSLREWKMALMFSLPILLVEEGIKYWKRREFTRSHATKSSPTSSLAF